MASTTPCPPEVPGSQAEINALEMFIAASTSIGLPENITVTRGILLSAERTLLMTSISNEAYSTLRVFSCEDVVYAF
jgi:hypothetical protein